MRSYGSIEAATNHHQMDQKLPEGDNRLLGNPHNINNKNTRTNSRSSSKQSMFEPSTDRRKQFAQRRERQSTKKFLKQVQSERAVFGTLFEPKASSFRKSKSRGLSGFSAASATGAGLLSPTTASRKKSNTSPLPEQHPLSEEEQQHHAVTKHRHHHSFLYTMLSPHSKSWHATAFKHFISLVISVDLILFILSTDETFTLLSDDFYHVAEGLASSIFLLEYLARIYTVTEKKRYAELGPVAGRLEYMRTFAAMIDLVSVLPFFLELPTGWHLPTLTYLRIIRLFRILKTEDYVKALDAVYRVIYYNRQILYVATLVCVFLVLITSVLLYYCRPKGDQSSPLFDSLGDTMYMSTLMLTGGGGPDTENLPWYTKAVVLLTSVFSVAMFAIPASMLTWGFEAEAERMAKQARKRVLQRREKQRIHSSNGGGDASFCSSTTSDYESEGYSDHNTTDEEYFQLIAGIDEEEDEDETPWMKEQRQKFQAADIDMDGTLTLKEYMKLQEQNQDSPLDPQNFLVRLQTLELQVADNSDKLGKILAILEQQQK